MRAGRGVAKATLFAGMIVMTGIATSRPAAASCASGSTLSASAVLSSSGAAQPAVPTSVRGDGRALPFTGAPVSTGVVVGGALLVAGAASLAAARPRRHNRRNGAGIALATAVMAAAFVIGLAPAASASPVDCGLGAEHQPSTGTDPAPLLPEAPLAVLLPTGALITFGVGRWRRIRPVERT